MAAFQAALCHVVCPHLQVALEGCTQQGSSSSPMRPPCSLAADGINPLDLPSSKAGVPNALLPAALLLHFYVTPCSLAADGINPEAQLKIIPVAVSRGGQLPGQQLRLG